MIRFLASFLLLFVLSGVQAEEVFLEDNGIRLNTQLSLADGKSVKDGVVLMLHGTFAHNQMEIMQTVADLLNEQGYSTLAITLGLNVDNRHGMLDCGITHTHQHTDALKEIGLWMEWLKEQGAGKVALLGHSRGGNQIAWYAAKNSDPLVESVVLIAPATWDIKYETADYKKRYNEELKTIMDRALEQQKRGNGEAIIRPVGFVYCPEAAVSADSFVDYYTDRPERNTPTVIQDIKVPVLVFAGSEDDVVKDLIPQVEAIQKPGKIDMVIIDGSDHFFRDLYAEDLVDEATAYLGWE
jgi:alpha-beta hydrolase superfamily lysophospholipase